MILESDFAEATLGGFLDCCRCDRWQAEIKPFATRQFPVERQPAALWPKTEIETEKLFGDFVVFSGSRGLWRNHKTKFYVSL